MILNNIYATASSALSRGSASGSTPTNTSENVGVPVPAGINLPTATFSLRPYK